MPCAEEDDDTKSKCFNSPENGTIVRNTLCENYSRILPSAPLLLYGTQLR